MRTDRRLVWDLPLRAFHWLFAVSILAARLGDRAYLVGASFTVADILTGHTLLWAKSARLELGSDSLVSYLNALTLRDAFARAREKAYVRLGTPTPNYFGTHESSSPISKRRNS